MTFRTSCIARLISAISLVRVRLTGYVLAVFSHDPQRPTIHFARFDLAKGGYKLLGDGTPELGELFDYLAVGQI